MYIGPWQEYKLAKILQLKDKIDKEEKESNKLESDSAASLSNKGTFNMKNDSNYANSQGFNNGQYNRSNYGSEKFKQTHVSEKNGARKFKKPVQHLARRNNRNRSHNMPKPDSMKYQYPSHVIKQANASGHVNNYIKAKGGKMSSMSPTSNNTNYSSKVVRTTSNSFKAAGDNTSHKSWHNAPSTRTLGGASNYETRSYASEMLNQMRQNRFNKVNMNRVIEVTYDKWNRFENFVKFASK